MPELVTSVSGLRELLAPDRRAGRAIGLVPTMGALHLGHRRLLEIARRETKTVVASIFVNPTQFDRQDDLDRYPRPLSRDLEICGEAGVDIVFAPMAAEMYPQTQLTWVDAPSLTQHLCGPGRPGHFRGVATVVMKLLQIVQPDRAYFGEKDAQQLAVIRRMVQDLNVPTAIVPVATVREPDGLAMSSRNAHLSPAERRTAVVLSQALFAARDLVRSGERSAASIRSVIAPMLAAVQVEYFSLVDPDTLTPVERIAGPVLIAAAIWIGKTRLIDNVTVSP
ncbi:MAG TPA: pantoate--beta-alanine ligase [Bryobacteraceae bacterium]|nr:pantoate--beta-alanine ligase [Bryobacteraceae bacterium]